MSVLATDEAIDLGAIALEGVGQWFVLHTRSRQEKALAADLSAMGVRCFLPMLKTVRYYGRRKARVVLPLFPNYVFLRGSLDDVYQADRTRRVASIIRVADQAGLQRELMQIHRVLLAEGELSLHPGLERGVWVEVTAGPFKRVRGQVEGYAKLDRLILQVQALGQASSLEIDAGLLRRIDPTESD